MDPKMIMNGFYLALNIVHCINILSEFNKNLRCHFFGTYSALHESVNNAYEIHFLKHLQKVMDFLPVHQNTG